MLEVTITPIGKSAQVDVAVIGGQEEISDFWARVNTSEPYQRVPLDDNRELELARLLNVEPINFLDNALWEIRLRTTAAEVLARLRRAMPETN